MKDKYSFKPIKPERKSFMFSLPVEVDDKINKLAQELSRSRSDIVAEAVIIFERIEEKKKHDTKD